MAEATSGVYVSVEMLTIFVITDIMLVHVYGG